MAASQAAKIKWSDHKPVGVPTWFRRSKIGLENHLWNRLTVFSRYFPLQKGAYNNFLIAGIVNTAMDKDSENQDPGAHIPGFNVKIPGAEREHVTEGTVVTNLTRLYPHLHVCARQVQFRQVLSRVELAPLVTHHLSLTSLPLTEASHTPSLVAEYDRHVRPFIDLIDNLRHFGLEKDVSLPSIVVVGDQSSGKSSTLEAISGIQLPRGSGRTEICLTQLLVQYIS